MTNKIYYREYKNIGTTQRIYHKTKLSQANLITNGDKNI